MSSENITEQLRKMAKTDFEGLLAAVLSDVVENQENHTKVLNRLDVHGGQVEKNTAAIEEMRKNNKITNIIGGAIGAALTGISAWIASKL
jgi:hypothetical protein